MEKRISEYLMFLISDVVTSQTSQRQILLKSSIFLILQYLQHYLQIGQKIDIFITEYAFNYIFISFNLINLNTEI